MEYLPFTTQSEHKLETYPSRFFTPVLIFLLYLATFFFAASSVRAQSSETDITSFSFTEQTGEAILTSNIFEIGLTEINTSSFLELVGASYENKVRLNPSFNQSDVNNLEIRFGSGTQKAHRFTIPAGSGAGVADADYAYQDYVDVPFQVWDVDNNKQLMVSYRDQKDDGNFNLVEFYTAAGDEANHSREYIFIHNVDYSLTADPNIVVNGGHMFDNIYFLWPYLTAGGVFDPNNLPVSTLAIEVANSTVDSEVIYGTDLTTLIPTIGIAANATVSPSSGLANDFSEPRIYKVTAEDGVTFEKYLVTVSEGILAHYPFNGSANDESVNGNDGTNNGATLTLDRLGNANSAYSFDFNNTISTPLDLEPDQPFSFAAWVKWDGNLGSFQTILSWWIEGGRVYIDVDPGGQLRFGDFFLSTGVDMPANEWVHLAGTDDANNFIKLYLNGVLVAEKNTNTNYDPGPMTIGGKNNGSVINETFSGDIDEIRIYGRVLTEAEVVDLSGRELFTETEITAFSIPEQISPAIFDSNNNTIDCEVLTGTDITALVADFTLSIGANAQVNGTDQESGTTANDFTSAVTYTITAEDGSTTEDWIIEVAFGNATIENDSLALLAIFNGTDGVNWTTTWDLLQPMDTWHGVTISDERVTSLDLNNNNLIGQFPVEIGILTGLTYLDLYGNQLSGVVPAEIGNLTNLTFLGLWRNQLSGNIPHEIGLLTELTNLDIGTNQFIGSIPLEIWNLSKLEYLGIYSTPVTGTIPTEIGNLVNLTWLQLLNTQISGTIPAEIGNLTKLEKLDMWNNELTGNIPVELGNLTNLIQLNYSDNQLNGSIPAELNNLVSLENLRLDRNNLTGSIPVELGDLINLRSLRLNDNNLNGSIPSELGNLTNIESIWLQFNELDGVLPSELGNLTNLFYLNLPGNNFTGSIPSTLENTNMTFLYLGDNNLTGPIPPELGNLTNLQDLRFEGNDLSGVIPETFSNLSNLNGLIINDNPNLSGSIPQSLTSLNLEFFILQNTGVCEPTNAPYQTWKSTVTNYQSSGIACDIAAAEIEAFSFTEQSSPATINPGDHTINLSVVYGTNLTALTSTFTLSSGASAKVGTTTQISNTTTNDFTNTVTYTVTAEDGITTQDWVVTVTISPNTEANIITLNFGEGSMINDYDGNVYPVVPIGPQLWMANNLMTTSYNEGTSIPLIINNSDWASLTSGAYSWFENNEAESKDLFGALYNWYSVETGKLCPIGWRVPTDEEWSTLGSFLGGNAVAGGKMKVTGTEFWNSPNTDATNQSGFSGLPGGNRNVGGSFGYRGSNGDWWTATEKDGTKAYPRDLQADNGSLNIEPNGSPKEFGFSIRCLQAPIDNKVGLVVPYGTDITSLDPTIALSIGATVQPANGIAQDFTNPVTYTVTAEDGTSTQDWVVTVSVAPNTETDIISYSLVQEAEPATIDPVNHTVDIAVVYGTNLTSLSPTIMLSEGAAVSPLSDVGQDFSGPVTYTVTAEDGTTTQDWVVTLTIAPNTETDIIAFSLTEQADDAIIDALNHTVDIAVVYGTNLTSLAPTIMLSEAATVSPQSDVAQDLSGPVTYTVTAEDGTTTQDWVVTVTIAPNTAAEILSFEIPEQTSTATIDPVNLTVNIEVENGSNLSSLTPTITLSNEATVFPGNLEAQDFTSPVTYTVTAQDGLNIKNWVVSVTEEFVLGIEDFTSAIHIFPNPANNMLNIGIHDALAGLSVLTITDLRGGVIEIINISSINQAVIDISSYRSGVYIIKIENKYQTFSNRFIKR